MDIDPAHELPDEPARERVTAEQTLAFAFESIHADQYDLNRRAAARAAGIADALAYVRSQPQIYALPGEPDASRTAERAAVLEASARLQLSEAVVRSLAHTADTARAALPELWRRAAEGFAALSLVESAVSLVPMMGADAANLSAFDSALAELALNATPAAFRRAARRLAQRLAAQPPEVRHAEARERRRVVIEPSEDGMSWIGACVPTIDAMAIDYRLNATASSMPIAERAGRTRDQLRADLFVAWLRGAGTPTAVKTKVFVTIPFTLLGKKARASVRGTPAPAGVPAAAPALSPLGADLNGEPQLIGDGDLDRDSALHELLEAGSFTRVITDPVTGAVLDMDRRARTVTRAQKEWLILSHSTCTRDGCTRHAAASDIDHWIPYGRDGATNIINLHPFCEPEHWAKHKTRLRFRRRPDLTVQLTSPTGFATRRLMWWRSTPQYEDPPF